MVVQCTAMEFRDRSTLLLKDAHISHLNLPSAHLFGPCFSSHLPFHPAGTPRKLLLSRPRSFEQIVLPRRESLKNCLAVRVSLFFGKLQNVMISCPVILTCILRPRRATHDQRLQKVSHAWHASVCRRWRILVHLLLCQPLRASGIVDTRRSRRQHRCTTLCFLPRFLLMLRVECTDARQHGELRVVMQRSRAHAAG